MPGFRMLTPFAPILLLIFFMIFSRLKINYTVSILQKALFFSLIAISTYFGLFSTSDKHRFYFDRSYYYSSAKEVAQYWNSMLTSNEVYVTAVAGALPYGANSLIIKDFHGLVNPCVGRDENLRGNAFGKRKWSCMFADNYIIQYVNTSGFAKEFDRHSKKNKVKFDVVVKNNNFVFSKGGSVTFIRQSNIKSLQIKDPSLKIISFDEYRKLHKF